MLGLLCHMYQLCVRHVSVIRHMHVSGMCYMLLLCSDVWEL